MPLFFNLSVIRALELDSRDLFTELIASGRFFGCFLTFTISDLELLHLIKLHMAMMVVDSGSSSKKRKRSNSKGKGPAEPVYVQIGPKMRSGAFSSGGMGAPSQKDPGYVDLAAGSYNLDTTGTITLLNTIAVGASNQQRVGKRIMLKSLQCRGYQITNSAAISTATAYLIVYDKRPCGVLPAITDVLDSATATSMNKDDNSGRFRVLKRVDRLLVGSVGNQVGARSGFEENWFLSLKNLPMVFNSVGTGAIGDIDEGALYLITVGNSVAGTLAATGVMGFRTRFLDN